jgi:hypothetical protein
MSDGKADSALSLMIGDGSGTVIAMLIRLVAWTYFDFSQRKRTCVPLETYHQFHHLDNSAEGDQIFHQRLADE